MVGDFDLRDSPGGLRDLRDSPDLLSPPYPEAQDLSSTLGLGKENDQLKPRR
jgi:hypothetical protein